MAKVYKVDHRVKEYLHNTDYKKWLRVHAPINRGGMITLNTVECINCWLVETRECLY